MKIEYSQFKELPYLVGFPDNYVESEKYPILLFLHGAGTRCEDITKLPNNIFFKLEAARENFPFIVVAPLCASNLTWFDYLKTLKELVIHIASRDFSDEERFYVMGNSMGGYGTWQLAMSMPEMFAAIVPICGGGMYWNAGRLVNVPVWAFHGGKDTVVYTVESERMVDAVNRKGGSAKLTIYPENGHDSWTDTFSNTEVYAWLLDHKNQNAKAVQDLIADTKIYG